MVALNFNLLGLVYQDGVGYLAKGFTTAATALRADRATIAAELVAYETHVNAGGDRIGEWEDGELLWEQDQVLRMRLEDADEALMDLRKAYCLAIYHHWERGARRWTRRVHGNHAKLAELTVELGYPVDARLAGLCDLVNTLKHNNVASARKLAASWGALLSADPHGPAERDWYNVVELTDDHVAEACDIIRGSGPTVDLLPVQVMRDDG